MMRLMCLLMALCLILSLTACGSQEAEETKPEAETAEAAIMAIDEQPEKTPAKGISQPETEKIPEEEEVFIPFQKPKPVSREYKDTDVVTLHSDAKRDIDQGWEGEIAVTYTNSEFSVWGINADYTTAKVIAEVKNVGDTAIDMYELMRLASVTLSDTEGNLCRGNITEYHPFVIQPGETGYLYGETDITEVWPEETPLQAQIFFEEVGTFHSDEAEINIEQPVSLGYRQLDNGELQLRLTVTNTANEEKDILFTCAQFDEEGNPIWCGSFMNLALSDVAGGETFDEISEPVDLKEFWQMENACSILIAASSSALF